MANLRCIRSQNGSRTFRTSHARPGTGYAVLEKVRISTASARGVELDGSHLPPNSPRRVHGTHLSEKNYQFFWGPYAIWFVSVFFSHVACPHHAVLRLCALVLLCYDRYDTRGCESDGQDFARVAAQGYGNQPLVRTYHNSSQSESSLTAESSSTSISILR